MKANNKNTKVNMVSAPAIEIESPEFKVLNNKDYILYGKKNDFPDILKEMMNTSSLHSAILKKKSDMSAGLGFEATTSEQKNFINNFINNTSIQKNTSTSFKWVYTPYFLGDYKSMQHLINKPTTLFVARMCQTLRFVSSFFSSSPFFPLF